MKQTQFATNSFGTHLVCLNHVLRTKKYAGKGLICTPLQKVMKEFLIKMTADTKLPARGQRSAYNIGIQLIWYIVLLSS